MSLAIRDVEPRDAGAIVRIYNRYIRDTIVTFEEDEISAADMAARIAHVRASLPWIVAEQGGAILGYAYARKFHERAAYRNTVESTIYVDEAAQRKGIGTNLYTALLDRLRAQGLRTALALIALPNAPSVALHEKCGFKKAAHLEKVGFKFGRWIDVGYWQLLL